MVRGAASGLLMRLTLFTTNSASYLKLKQVVEPRVTPYIVT